MLAVVGADQHAIVTDPRWLGSSLERESLRARLLADR
jgi:hypothetical protein